MRWSCWVLSTLLFYSTFAVPPSLASPWAEVGDSQLRSDLAILANAGIIDDVTTHWPIPWAGIMTHLRAEGALADQPPYVREAARRVLDMAQKEMRVGQLRSEVTVDITNRPDVVRGFGAMGLGEAQSQLSLEYMSSTTAARLSAGIFVSKFKGGDKQFMPDGSYVAQKNRRSACIRWLSHTLVGTRLDFSSIVLKQCTAVSASGHRTGQYRRIQVTVAELAWSVADGIPDRLV